MKLIPIATFLGASGLVIVTSRTAQAQPAAPAAPAPTTAAAPATPAAPTAVAPAPAAPAPAANSATPAVTTAQPAEPPATAAPAAPVPAAPSALPPAAPAPIQLAPAPDQAEIHARNERAAAKSRAAVKSSPFMDATLNGTWLEDRFGDPFVFGIQGGAYLGEIVRLTIRLEMPTENSRDEYGYNSDPAPQVPNGSFSNPLRSEPPTLLYGATLGAVATNSENFVFAPGLVFVRSDVSDYGSMLGVSMPFEWVTSRGMRFGLELDLGRAFGGKVQNQVCTNDSTSCTTADSDRSAGRAFALRFSMGFGFNRPR